MSNRPEYLIISESDANDLEHTVNDFINKGYTCLGGLAISNHNGFREYCQAMIKEIKTISE